MLQEIVERTQTRLFRERLRLAIEWRWDGRTQRQHHGEVEHRDVTSRDSALWTTTAAASYASQHQHRCAALVPFYIWVQDTGFRLLPPGLELPKWRKVWQVGRKTRQSSGGDGSVVSTQDGALLPRAGGATQQKELSRVPGDPGKASRPHHNELSEMAKQKAEAQKGSIRRLRGEVNWVKCLCS